VGRVVTSSFEVAGDPQARDDRAEVAGDRLLACQQVEGAGVDPVVRRVDLGVAFDDGFGGHQVGLEQRVRGAPDRRGHARRQLDQRRRQDVELLVVRVAHGPRFGAADGGRRISR
jgi:hypothetical protein